MRTHEGFRLLLPVGCLVLLGSSVGLAQEAATGQTRPSVASAAPSETASGPAAISPEALARASELETQGGDLFEKGDFRGALVKLSEAVVNDPTRDGAWYDMALCYTYLGQEKMARYCILRVESLGAGVSFLERELEETLRPARRESPPQSRPPEPE